MTNRFGLQVDVSSILKEQSDDVNVLAVVVTLTIHQIRCVVDRTLAVLGGGFEWVGGLLVEGMGGWVVDGGDERVDC